MHRSQSQNTISKRSGLLLPKIKTSGNLELHMRNPSLDVVSKTKRSHMLLNQLRPARDMEILSESQEGQTAAKRIETPQNFKKKLKPGLAILRYSNRYVKEIFIGEEAVQKFYNHYKYSSKIQQKEHFHRQTNIITEIVRLLQDHGFAPRKLDLIKLKGEHSILDLKNLGLGQGRLGAVVTRLIDLMDNFEFVDLSYNQIDRSVSQHFVSALSRVKIINLSHNRIGKVACDQFPEMFLNTQTCIQQLYLSDNSLMDNAGAVLAKGLTQYKFLRILDLSHNFLSQRFATEMKQYLKNDQSLEQLYLGWNEIIDKSARLIFEGIYEHEALKVFDYSWNVIGIFSVDSLAKIFREKSLLMHVDISFCDIDKNCSQILAEALKNNHSIYGLHYEGNSGFVDGKGYLKLTAKEFSQYPLPVVKGIIRKIDSIKPNPIVNEFKSSEYRDCCWICESWQQVSFKVKNTNPEVKQCYLHLKSEGFKSIKMQNSADTFELNRMFPIGMIEFFFTFTKGPGKREHFTCSTYSIRQLNKTLQFSIGQIKVRAFLAQINCLQIQYSQDVINEDFEPNISCVPRSQQAVVKFKEIKKVKVRRKVIRAQKLKMMYKQLDETGAESFLNSFDRDQDKNYLMKCLQFDIANSKIRQVIKKEQDLLAFKEMMINYYRAFKDTFYYLSKSTPSIHGIYCISQNSFLTFLQEQRYISKRVTLPQIMLKMYATLSISETSEKINKISSNKKDENVKLFCRPQFLQFLIRLAMQKWCTGPPNYFKRKKQEPKIQAKKEQSQEHPKKLSLPLPLIQGLERTMKSLVRYGHRVRASVWRIQKFKTIDMYTVIKGYETFLISLFEKYSESKKKMDKPKKLRNLLTLDQFKSIFIDTALKRTKQAASDCQIPYLYSKQLQIQDGQLQFGLSYNQFCECLARYSQVLYFPPIVSEKNQLWQSESARRFIPLFIKFQSIIVNIYRNSIQFHNKKMNKIALHGLFSQQSQILLQKIQMLSKKFSNSELASKINSLDFEQISLKQLIQQLKQKYQNVTIFKQQYVQSQQERISQN